MVHLRKLSLPLLIAAAGFAGAEPPPQESQTVQPANKILAHALDVETGRAGAVARPHEQHLSSGVLYPLLTAAGALGKHNQASFAPALNASNGSGSNGSGSEQGSGTQGCSNVFSQGNRRNVRVNQDCSLRRQAEEAVVVNPTQPR